MSDTRLAAAGLLSTPAGHPLPVYLTEFGYYRSGPHALAPDTRAAYLVRAFGIAARLYPRVRQILQYLLVAPPPGYPGGRFDTSKCRRGTSCHEDHNPLVPGLCPVAEGPFPPQSRPVIADLGVVIVKEVGADPRAQIHAGRRLDAITVELVAVL